MAQSRLTSDQVSGFLMFLEWLKTKGKSKGKKKGKDIIAKRPAGLLAASFERASKKLHVEVDDDEEKLSEKAAEESEEEDENNP